MNALGRHIRRFRKKEEITIRELAKRAGLTASLISQIEQGLCNPSVASLRKIAEVLDVPTYRFFLDDGEVEEILRCEERPILALPHLGVLYTFLSHGVKTRLEVLLWNVEVGGNTGEALDSHAGEEWIIVLEGKLELVIGDNTYLLGKYDSIHFDSGKLHRWRNAGNTPLEAMSIGMPSL